MLMRDSRGRVVLARAVIGDRVVTLAEIGGFHPYVTWRSRKSSPDDTFWGHYHGTLESALEDFVERCKGA